MNWKSLAFNQRLAIYVAVAAFLGSASTQVTDILLPVMSPAMAAAVTKSFTALCGIVAGVGASVLAFFTSKQNVVSDVVQMAKDPTSPVQGVITSNTPEGNALAQSIPGPIVTAGGASAVELAKA